MSPRILPAPFHGRRSRSTGTRHRIAAALLPLVLLATACSGDGDPQEQLHDAVVATFEDSFSYRMTLDATPEALRSLGEGAAAAAGFLQGFALTGERTADGFSARLRVLGVDVVELQRTATDRYQFRAAVPQIAALAGQSELVDPAAIRPRLADLGVTPEVETAVLAALAGDWVAIEGELTAAELQRALGLESSGEATDVRAAVDETLGPDLAAAIERFVEARDRGEAPEGGTRIDVALLFGDLLRALGELEARLDPSDAGDLAGLRDDLEGVESEVPGSVDVRDGVIEALRFDLAGTTGGEAAEPLLVQVELTDHGSAPAVTVPAGATTISAAAFLDAIATVLAFTGTP